MISQLTDLPRRYGRIALIIAGVFLLVRGIFLQQISHSPLLSLLILDSDFYYRWAVSLASGHGHPPGAFWLSPLYPVFLAGVFAATGSTSPVVVVILQFLLSLGTLILITLLARRLFDAETALVTAALAALFAPWVYYDGVLLSASLILFLNAALLLVLVRAQTSPAAEDAFSRFHGGWLIVGLLCGLSALARPSILIFVFLLLLGLVLDRPPQFWRKGLMLSAGTVALLIPVLIRNWAVEGSPVLTTSSAGVNFFIGNRAGASGVYDELNFVKSFDPERESEGYRAEASRITGVPMTLNQASRFWGRMAAEDILADPGRWLLLLVRKLWLTVQREEIPTNLSFRGVAGFSPILGALPLRWALLFPLAVAGAALVWRKRRDLTVLWLYGLTYFLVNVIFFSSSEYRFPLVVILLPAAAGFWVEMWRIIAARDWQRLLIGCLIYFVALVVVNFPSRETRRLTIPRSDYYNLATTAVDQGRFLEAIPLYARALSVDASYQEARVGLAEALWRVGSYDDARREYALAGVVPPDTLSGSPLQGLLDEINVMTEEGEWEAALRLLDSSFPPELAAPLDVLAARADLETRLGLLERARHTALLAHRIEPDSPVWLYRSGMLALAVHDTTAADSLLREALKRHAAYAPARVTLAEIALARSDFETAQHELTELADIRIPDDSVRSQVNWLRQRLEAAKRM